MSGSALPIDIFNDGSQIAKAFVSLAEGRGVEFRSGISTFYYQGPINNCPFIDGLQNDPALFLYSERVFINYGLADDIEKTLDFVMPAGFVSKSISIRRPVVSFDVGNADLHGSNGHFHDLICNTIEIAEGFVGTEGIIIFGWTGEIKL
jgi:hypothetical protein